MAGVYEALPHRFERRRRLDALDVGAGHHHLAHAQRAEGEHVREHVVLLADVNLGLAVFQEQDLEVAPHELAEFLGVGAEQLGEQTRRATSHFYERHEQQVAHAQGQAKHEHGAVGRLPRKRLRDDLAHDEHDRRGDKRLRDEHGHVCRALTQPRRPFEKAGERRVEVEGDKGGVEHERQVGAHERRREKGRRVAQKLQHGLARGAAPPRLHLHPQPARRHERDLRPGEKGHQAEHQQNEDEVHREWAIFNLAIAKYQ